MKQLKISIIVPTFNRGSATLRRLFDSLKKQKNRNYEILLVDQSSDAILRKDNVDVCNDYAVRYADISKMQPSLTASRNFGVDNIDGDIVLFLDDDTELVNESYLDEILGVFEKYPDTVGVSGFNIPPPNTTYLGKSVLLFKRFFLHLFFAFNPFNTQEVTGYFHNVDFYKKPKKVSEVDWLYGSNMSYKRGLFERIRFDENLKRYSLREDVDFSFRAKKFGRLYVTPSAPIYHFEEKKGRINFKKRTLMELSYWAYLYYKNMEEPKEFVLKANSLLIFLRYLKKAIFSLSKENINAVIYANYVFTKNLNEIKKLNLSSINREI